MNLFKSVQLGLLFCAITCNSYAEIKEPDNLLYGSIMLDNQLVTAAQSHIVIEARRTPNGPAISRYRMGSNPRFQNFYSLEIPLESILPILNTNASQTGEFLTIVVLDSSGIRGQAVFTLRQRGTVERVDFGTVSGDSDGDGLPDAWENYHFGNLSQSGNSLGLNGVTLAYNFNSGSNPANTNELFELKTGTTNNLRTITFVALRAEGPGFEGKTRFYSLENSSSLGSPAWIGVPGFTNLIGNNQAWTYSFPLTDPPAFFRGKVWLEP